MTDPAYKLVPPRATKEMEAAAIAAVAPYHDLPADEWQSVMPGDLFRLAWPAMLAAAPEPPLTEAGREAVSHTVINDIMQNWDVPDALARIKSGIGHGSLACDILAAELDAVAEDVRAAILAALAHHPAQTPTPDEAAIRAEERDVLERAIDRLGWPEIHAYEAELRKGQDIYEDAGGFMLRAIKALFGLKRADPVVTYQAAARALVSDALATPDLNQGRVE